MARFRNRGMSIRPVQRIKHVVDVQGGAVGGTQVNTAVVQATDTPTLAGTTEVITGAKVNGIYLKVEVSASAGTALANVYMLVFKNQGGNLGTPAANGVGSSDNKRFGIHQEMIMIQKFDGDVSSNPRVLFNGVIAIPRGYRRFGPNDILQVAVLSPGTGNNIDFCLQCHYKEFR